MKPSSRSGRFKKKLITHQELQKEVPTFLTQFLPSYELYKNGVLTAAELTTHYLFLGLSIRYPGTWAGAFQKTEYINHNLHCTIPEQFHFEPNVHKRLNGMSLGDILNHFALKSTPKAVNRAILNFSTGKYPLELMFHIPTPLEVLSQQKEGRRCLTLIVKEKQMKDYILGERDYLGFCLHDLIHADHFYHSNLSYNGQLGLYNLLWNEIQEGVFAELLTHKEFEREFEYIISDMNAYPIHLLKCLKSAITFYESESWFNNWASRFDVYENLIRLNKKEYEPDKEDPVLLAWLNGYLRNKLS